MDKKTEGKEGEGGKEAFFTFSLFFLFFYFFHSGYFYLQSTVRTAFADWTIASKKPLAKAGPEGGSIPSKLSQDK